MSNSNYDNVSGQENYRSHSNNDRSNFRDRSGGRRDGGGFRIRLSDNEMKAVKTIQETFQLRSTVAVLGFSVRTLSEMIKDENLIESITKYAKNNQNSSPTRQSPTSGENKTKTAPDPFARPIKVSSNEDVQINNVDEEVQIKKEEEDDN